MRDVFDDDKLKGIFVEVLNEEYPRSVQKYWSSHRSIRMHALIAFDVSTDTTHAIRKRELGTRTQKISDPVGPT